MRLPALAMSSSPRGRAPSRRPRCCASRRCRCRPARNLCRLRRSRPARASRQAARTRGSAPSSWRDLAHDYACRARRGPRRRAQREWRPIRKTRPARPACRQSATARRPRIRHSHADAAPLSSRRGARAPNGAPEIPRSRQASAPAPTYSEIAEIIGRADRRLVRHRRARDEIAPPDLGGIEGECIGDHTRSARRSST